MKLLTSILLMFSTAALADYQPAETTKYFQFLMRLNSVSPLEHAGSHGTLGLGLGLGLGVYHAGVDPLIFREHWRNLNQSTVDRQMGNQRVVLPRIYAHKGLPYSVDIGFGFGQDVATRAKLISGYGQWTPIEGFAMPALAIRAGFSRLMNLATTDASSVSLDGVLSYGFLKLFTIYGSMGISRHQMQVRSGEEYGTTLSLAPFGSGGVESVRVGRTRALGLQVQILPPFFVSTAEVQQSGTGALSYLAKLSLGI